MVKTQDKDGVLVLESGLKFEGTRFGAKLDAASIETLCAKRAQPASQSGSATPDRGYGEVVFNTSMTGYQEILTDPSYFGQLVCMTTPHIGNTGVNAEDAESARPWAAGFVINELSGHISNWRSEDGLEEYLSKAGIPGLFGVDTRALTRHLRSLGVTRGLILKREEAHLAEALFKRLPSFEGRDMIGEVTTPKAYRWREVAPQRGFAQPHTSTKKPYKVVALDYGIKWNLLRGLEDAGCDVEVMPATTTAAEVLARKPDGVFLSNGPGDPAAAPYAAKTVQGILGKVPLFGVCMGHQILALSMGAKTYKLKFGHRGGNQPVLDKTTEKVEISSHNHGYAVDGKSLPAKAKVTHVNLNDQCCEGLEVVSEKAFSVQYHPEACPGPHDSAHLFRKFVDLMGSR